MLEKISININDKEYKLLITLGFWKDLSFSKSEATSIYSDSKRLFECIKLAVFYGNKKEFGWNCLNDMLKEIPDEAFEEIESDPVELIGKAFYEYLPDDMKKKADELEADLLKGDDVKKK